MGKGMPIKINPRRARGNTECMEEVGGGGSRGRAALRATLRACAPAQQGAALPLQMTAFFICMGKFTDVEDKCAAERRALTNCATAAVGGAALAAARGPASWHFTGRKLRCCFRMWLLLLTKLPLPACRRGEARPSTQSTTTCSALAA